MTSKFGCIILVFFYDLFGLPMDLSRLLHLSTVFHSFTEVN